MTKENKSLLLVDLCARLPYGIQIHIDFNGNGHIVGDATLNTITSITGQFFDFTDFKQDFKNGDCCPISGFGSNRLLHLGEFIPYLRPMSSMTEEEKHKLLKFGAVTCLENGEVVDVSCVGFERHADIQDYLNACHFDYRGLIEKGLALEATEGMYES